MLKLSSVRADKLLFYQFSNDIKAVFLKKPLIKYALDFVDLLSALLIYFWIKKNNLFNNNFYK